MENNISTIDKAEVMPEGMENYFKTRLEFLDFVRAQWIMRRRLKVMIDQNKDQQQSREFKEIAAMFHNLNHFIDRVMKLDNHNEIYSHCNRQFTK